MELLVSPFPTLAAPALALLGAALLLARAITVLERRLVTSVAVLLAGVFFLARSGGAPVETAVGASAWGLGLGAFVDAALAWHSGAASRIGPLATLLLLPAAFTGAVMAGGIVIGLLSG